MSVDRDAATMADQTKKATGVPLTNIAVLLALLGGVALYRLPLTSPRPGVEPARGSAGWSGQDVDARLWQDPLDVSSKHRDALPHGDGVSGHERQAESYAHSIEPVRLLLNPEGSRGDRDGENPPRILAVMVPGGAYEEHVERRLRTRHAVVEGLSAMGLVPDDYLHIGYFETAWPTDGASLNYPPFRDAYETSAFAATLAAVRGGASPNLPPPVRLYEIGRSGAFRIPDPTIDGNRSDTAAPPDARPSGVRWLGMTIALVCLVFLLIWAKNMHDGTLTPAVADGVSPRSKLKPPTGWEIATQTPLFLVVVCVPAVLLLFLVAEYLARHGGEPVSLFQGISIWPSEAIRLLVGLLGIHFCAKSVAAIDESNVALAKAFHLNDPPEHGEEEKGRVVASTIWKQYVNAGAFAARVRRIRLPFVAYYAFGFALVAMMGMPRVPGRGEFDVLVNFVVTVLFAVSVTIFLLFFVIDVMWLNRVMLIEKLMDSPTRWPEKLLREYRPGEGDSKIDACLSELLDIKLIAARTAVTGPLIYWPFLLLALMIVSRLQYFDDWDFPITLIVVFALNAAGAIFAALTLRQSAEYARTRALETLHKLLYEATISTEGKETPEPRDRALGGDREEGDRGGREPERRRLRLVHAEPRGPGDPAPRRRQHHRRGAVAAAVADRGARARRS